MKFGKTCKDENKTPIWVSLYIMPNINYVLARVENRTDFMHEQRSEIKN